MTLIIQAAVSCQQQVVVTSTFLMTFFRTFKKYSKTDIMSNQTVIKHWWISLLPGILFILTGIWVSLTPLASYVALSILFSMLFFVNGVLEILFAIVNR
jgi:uncharacterized membrane protein HdeD (DUF308 family)